MSSSSAQCLCPNPQQQIRDDFIAPSFAAPRATPLRSVSEPPPPPSESPPPPDEPGTEILVLVVAAFLGFAFLLRRLLSTRKKRVKAAKSGHIPSPVRAKIISHRNSISANEVQSDDQLIDSALRQRKLRMPQQPVSLLNVPASPRSQVRGIDRRRVSNDTASDSPATPLTPQTPPPIRHFKYYSNSSKKSSANQKRRHHFLQSHLSGSDFDANSARFDLNAENSDSDAVNPDLMPMPPQHRRTFSSSAEEPHHLIQQTEQGIPVAKSVPSFTFPSRNPSSNSTAPLPIQVPFQHPTPPSMTRDASLSSLRKQTAPADIDSATDQHSYKSGISRATSTREFEQVMKLRDDGESESSATTAPPTSSSSVPFWKRGFSRPPSVNELQDASISPPNSASNSVPTTSTTSSSILPKLTLFKRKSNADLTSALSPGLGGDKPAVPQSPVAAVMKGFWPIKSSASAAGSGNSRVGSPATLGDHVEPVSLLAKEESSTVDDAVGRGVPILSLPTKKGKKATALSSTKKAAVDETGKASVKEPSVSRFWPSGSSAATKQQQTETSSKGKSPAVSASSMKFGSVDTKSLDSGEQNNHGEGGSISSATSKSYWGKQRTPAISYAKAAAKTDTEEPPQQATGSLHSSVSGNRSENPVSVNVDDDWMDVDDGTQENKQSMLSRFSKWQSGGKTKSSSHIKGLNHDAKSFAPSTASSASKFFGLRKRASHETMKNEFLRMATSSPSNEPSQLMDYSESPQPAYNPMVPRNDSFINTPLFLLSDYDRPLYNQQHNHNDSQSHQDIIHRPKPRYQQFSEYNHLSPTKLYDSDDAISLSGFQMRRKPSLVEPIHRPNSANRTRSISSAPGSNLKGGASTDVEPDSSALYSPFFSGLEIPMTQTKAPASLSSASSFHLDGSTSSINDSRASHRSRHHHYHHHHHFYHFPADQQGGGGQQVQQQQQPVNMPLVNVQELAGNFRRLRKLSHDAGLYGGGSSSTDFVERGSGSGSKLGGRVSGSTIGSFVTVVDDEDNA
ncbi:hypothetical protein BCR33DRAFT_710945 [Rhizoclosmatium globosum]|uniref:Uncharacterized protein n=1 Tax=Rhizoclosmatium globosum TaxID=329046 RepID=A0A1Y2D2R3_9FUNG|nr:hypothetical protein BCR33DRAFT_710945 [Rhizoclosmatium globosum]|eukprot:ORY53540.1 hypothetical protein BCR33DRAFT_710945 [Rhizoclosmatium globosum]